MWALYEGKVAETRAKNQANLQKWYGKQAKRKMWVDLASLLVGNVAQAAQTKAMLG